MPSSVSNIISKGKEKIQDGVEKFRDKTVPNHSADKEFDSDCVSALRLGSIAGLATSIALAAIGIPVAFTDGTSGDIGKLIVFVSLPLCFFTYNSVRFSENLYEVVNNPSAYKTAAGVGKNFNAQKLKEKLKTNTIGVSPIINLTVDSFLAWLKKNKDN